jgi:hypothetical protein
LKFMPWKLGCPLTPWEDLLSDGQSSENQIPDTDRSHAPRGNAALDALRPPLKS